MEMGEHIEDPEFGPEPGWRPLNMPRRFGEGRSFVSGDIDTDRIKINYYLRESDEHLMAKLWFGLGAEGPPGHAHGGSLAAVLDEAMGFVSWVSGHPVVAASIQVNFKKKTPLHHVYLVDSWVTAVADKKIKAFARIYDPVTDTDFATGEGLFVLQPIDKFGALTNSVNEKERSLNRMMGKAE